MRFQLYKHIWLELWHSFRSMHSLLMQQTFYVNEAWVEKRHFIEMIIIMFMSLFYSILKIRTEETFPVLVYLWAIFSLNHSKKKKNEFSFKCKVIFQRNGSVKGHAGLKWFLSFFQNWNEIFFSIELEWSSWKIPFKIKPTQYTHEKYCIQCERCNNTNSHKSKQMSIAYQ